MQMSPQIRPILVLLVSLGLAACMNGSDGTTGPRGPSNVVATERDVEDPRVFSKRETGLWDGRPSLGGVWVAHPDVTSPERVIIRNTENGQETIGALFRRERLNPGPSFQLSAEAATAIGMLAGAPTMLEVIALRIEEIAPATDATAPTEVAQGPAAAPAPVEMAAAALPASDTGGDATATGTGMIAPPETEVVPPRSGGLFGRIFGRRDSAAAPQAAAEIAVDPIQSAARDDAVAAPQAAAPAVVGTAPATPGDSALAQPFIQLGIFSVEANARNAERMASGADLSARVVPGQASGNQFWRVIVGPANSQAEQRQMLARVRALGFNDAYAVRR